jgi:hypothetical protein
VRVEQTGGATLYLGDCLEKMKELPEEKSYDRDGEIIRNEDENRGENND